MFAREVDSIPAMAAVLQDAVFLKIDCENGEGPEIAAKYGVKGYPTFITVDGGGEVTDRWIGYDGAELWIEAVTRAKGDTRTMAAKQEAYAAAPTAALARSLGDNAAGSLDFLGAVPYYRHARDLSPQEGSFFARQIVTCLAYGSRGGEVDFADVAAEADLALADPDLGPLELIDLVMMIDRTAGNLEATERAVPYIQRALAATADDPAEDVVKARRPLLIEHALLVEKDGAKAAALRKEGLPEGWRDDPDRLNSFAWWCFEKGINLAEAQELALRGVELAGDDQQRANLLDTLAEICAARGDRAAAVAHIRRAVELAPDKEYFKEQLAKFEAPPAAKGGEG